MTAYFPITDPISNDAHAIMHALNSRSEQLKSMIESQSLWKKISLEALKALGLASGIVTIASIPVSGLMFAATPITIGVVALCMTISCLALYMLVNPKSPGELIIKDQWKSVFNALRKGNGKEILETCQELARQKEKRLSSFNQCLGYVLPNEITPFFHKSCLVGHLQIAMDHLRKGEEEEAKSNAHMALSHFGGSGFSKEIKYFIDEIAESPKKMKKLIEKHQAGKDLHALDYLVAAKTV